MEDIGDEEADGEIDRGVDDALAELFQVLHQAHAGEFRALGDGLAGFFDGFLRDQPWCAAGSDLSASGADAPASELTVSGDLAGVGGEKLLLRGACPGRSAATVSPVEGG